MNIQKILDDHKLWLNTNGKKGKLANLQDANLQDANLRYANLRGAKLRDADLRGADLRGVNLQDANLQDADLQDANLQRADLRGANLRDADLRGADLRGVNLQDADLRGANLWGCVGNGVYVKSMYISELYPIVYTFDRLQIGCKNYSFSEWKQFSDDDISRMDESALSFWKEFKEYIFLTIEKFPAKPTKEDNLRCHF